MLTERDQQVRKLFETVGDAPDDTTARCVLADLLTEVGDPRGEYLQLQLRIASGQFSGPMRHRAEQLWRQNSRRWFAELRPFLDKFELESGFPVEGWLARGLELESMKEAFSLPAFVTLQRLHGEWPLVLAAHASPRMAALTFAEVTTNLRLLQLARHAVPQRLTHLRYHGLLTDEVVRALATSPAFSRLRRLELLGVVVGRSERDAVDTLDQLRAHPRLECLVLTVRSLRAPAVSAAWPRLGLTRLELVADLPALESWSVGPRCPGRLTLERTDEGTSMLVQGVSRPQMLSLRPMVPEGTTHVGFISRMGDHGDVSPEDVLAAYQCLSPSLY